VKFIPYATLFCIIGLFSSCKTNTFEADIRIVNGTVYNGIDEHASRVDIAIADDKIIYVGEANKTHIKATRTIDATGLIVSPGFIDPHTHADRDLNNPDTSDNLPFVMQGVTTVVAGNDGDSFYPLDQYKKLYRQHGIGTNVILLVGHGTVRKIVLGESNRRATPSEVLKMQVLIQQEMDAGAFGMSSGLFYAPGSYSATDEVISLAEVVSRNDGIYDTHLRDESTYNIGLLAAIQEAVEIGKQARLPIHISHIKCLGVDVWHQSDTIVKLIEKHRREGLKITANQYPYEASATSLKAAVVPRWAESGGMDSLFIRYKNPTLRARILKETKRNITRRGGPNKLLIVQANDGLLLGKNLSEVSSMLSLPAEAAVFELIKSGYIRVASFNMHMDDIQHFMQQNWVVTGSDGNTGHPRKYGSFPRKYARFVKKNQVISMADFINKSSARSAEIFGIKDRGKIKEGYYADIIIFDPENFTDKADYTQPYQYATGLQFSIINGRLAVENGTFTGERLGRVLEK